MLSKRQRVLASIRRESLDALPWQFDLTAVAAGKLKAYFGTEDLLSATDDHFVCTGDKCGDAGEITDASGHKLVRDEFGALWQREARNKQVGDWGELHQSPLQQPNLSGYAFPDASRPGRWEHVPELRKKYPDHFLMAYGQGLFERGWSLCGFENYLAWIAGELSFIEELTERLADYSCQTTGQLNGLGVDGIRFGDDWGFQDRLMIRPELWRKLFKKHYRRIYEAARKAGLVVMIHSCGNITDLLPDCIEIGVQVVHPLQPEAMDVAFCQKKFGRDLAFWGGLGSQSTLPKGTPEDNRREVRERLRLFHDGGYILAPAGAAPTETPAENLVAIIETAREQLKSGAAPRGKKPAGVRPLCGR